MSGFQAFWKRFAAVAAAIAALSDPAFAQAPVSRPNILVIFGDDIGQTNVSAYSFGVMGYKTPSIDRLACEGMMFTDYYAEQSCTAGRSSFITGQATLRTGLSKVGLPGAALGLQAEDITIAEALKPLGYATGQFGKNHLGDRNEFLPTVHGLRAVARLQEPDLSRNRAVVQRRARANSRSPPTKRCARSCATHGEPHEDHHPRRTDRRRPGDGAVGKRAPGVGHRSDHGDR